MAIHSACITDIAHKNRNHLYKLYKPSVTTRQRSNFFSIRVISNWNNCQITLVLHRFWIASKMHSAICYLRLLNFDYCTLAVAFCNDKVLQDTKVRYYSSTSTNTSTINTVTGRSIKVLLIWLTALLWYLEYMWPVSRNRRIAPDTSMLWQLYLSDCCIRVSWSCYIYM